MNMTKDALPPSRGREALPTASDELHVRGDPSDPSNLRVAKTVLGPVAASAMTARTYTSWLFGPTSMNDAVAALESSVNTAQTGSLRDAEAILVTQAIALNAISNELALRAHGQDQIKRLETFMRLALKAQNQCRMTLETLAVIKNPPVVFARQANITSGPQQVNNGAAPGSAPHAAKPKSQQTELLEASDGKRLDTSATCSAGGADSRVETVGTVDRASQ